MKEILATPVKGATGIVGAYFFANLPGWIDLYHDVGAVISAGIVVATGFCVMLDLRHKWRREKREELRGYEPDEDE